MEEFGLAVSAVMPLQDQPSALQLLADGGAFLCDTSTCCQGSPLGAYGFG
jgi:hypothetical protein